MFTIDLSVVSKTLKAPSSVDDLKIRAYVKENTVNSDVVVEILETDFENVSKLVKELKTRLPNYDSVMFTGLTGYIALKQQIALSTKAINNLTHQLINDLEFNQ